MPVIIENPSLYRRWVKGRGAAPYMADLVGQIRGEDVTSPAQGYPHRRMDLGAMQLQVSKRLRFNVKLSRVA